MGDLIDIKGQRFSRFLVIRRSGVTSDGKPAWLCKCDCGTLKKISGKYLRGGQIKSCGCLRKEKRSDKICISHTVEYITWKSMLNRCYGNKNTKDLYNYKKRGIKVCRRWNKFNNFLSDMGYRPSFGYSLDRINNNGNYEPSNCRWATWKQQANNRRGNRICNFLGKKDTLSNWCRRLGLKRNIVKHRLDYCNWSIEHALLIPT